MQNRTMNVYYGIDRLPYKDEARETHYPIISSTSGGNLIIGENNTSTIRFFVGLIGGANRQWIANIKKPDGTLSYQLLSGQASGSDYVCNLDISNLYTDQTGACFISLQGYSGETVITEDEGSYEISGNPVVIATGVVKVMINYAPNVFPKGETLQPTTEQQILANFSNYQQKYILENVRYYQGLANYIADLSNLSNGQLSLLKDGEKIKLVAKDTSTQLGYVILYCDMADKAFKDESGNNIKASYGASIEFSNLGKTATANVIPLVLYNKNGVSLSTNAFSLVSATSSLAGLMSASDKVKLDQLTGTPLIYKGSVATYDDLPTLISEPTMVSGWVYNTLDTGENYASVVEIVGGEKRLSWVKFGGDLSQFIKKDGSVAMTGDFNAGGHNLDDVDEVYANTINTESLDNVNGEPIEVMQHIDMLSNSTIKNLPNATSNDEAVNLGQMNTALASYRTMAEQNDIDNDLREQIAGKATTLVLSYNDTLTLLKGRLAEESYTVYRYSGTTGLFTNAKQSVLDGDYDDETFNNSFFNSQNFAITPSSSGDFLIFSVEGKHCIANFDDLCSLTNHLLHSGNNILIDETEVPDRWFSGLLEDGFKILETQKVDLTNVAKKNEQNTFSAVQNFNYGISVQNNQSTQLGSWDILPQGSYLYFRYNTGNIFKLGPSYIELNKDLQIPIGKSITNGVISITVGDIDGNITTKTTDSVSTTFSGTLTSNTDYKFSVLTSIAISSLMIKPYDQAPSWKMGFTVGTGLTCTLPSGCSWAGGTPDFTTMVGEYHFILIETTSTANTYLAYLI